jgi:hypothetical protein
VFAKESAAVLTMLTTSDTVNELFFFNSFFSSLEVRARNWATAIRSHSFSGKFSTALVLALSYSAAARAFAAYSNKESALQQLDGTRRGVPWALRCRGEEGATDHRLENSATDFMVSVVYEEPHSPLR